MKYIWAWILSGIVILGGLVYLVAKSSQTSSPPGTQPAGSPITIDLSAF